MNELSINNIIFSNNLIPKFEYEKIDEIFFVKLFINDTDKFMIANEEGYFEPSNNFLKDNNLLNLKDIVTFYIGNPNLFFNKLFKYKETGIIFNFTEINEQIYNTNAFSIDYKKYNEKVRLLKKEYGRAVTFWYKSLFNDCFGFYKPQKVKLSLSGFELIELHKEKNVDLKTIKNNFNKLKDLNLIKFNFEGNNVKDLKFNADLMWIDNYPSIFFTSFYTEKKQYESINHKLKEINKLDFAKGNNKRQINYIEKQIQNTEIGVKSEKIAYNFELERLKKLGFDNYNDLVKIVSEDNELGYDIISKEKNGDLRFIEVKTVKTNSNEINSFYLTNNELEKINELDNYYFYIVTHNENEPKIEIIKAFEFINSNKSILKPINYKVFYKY